MVLLYETSTLPTLRPYQIKAKQNIYDSIKRGINRVLCVSPTGSGKTTIAASIVYDAVQAGKRVAFVVHRDILIDQTMESFSRWGLKCGALAGGRKQDRSAMVQVCSFQTLDAASTDLSWLNSIDIWVADEAHYTSYTSVMLNKFTPTGNRSIKEEGIYIGLTATPWRLKKGESLGTIFDDVVIVASYRELIEQGFLTQPVYYKVQNASGTMQSSIKYIIEQWQITAQRSQTIAFCESVSHAEQLALAFEAVGIKAACITGATSQAKRTKILQQFRDEQITVLTGCNALNEGLDLPNARVAILARNVRSRSLLYQMLGRVMRPHTCQFTGTRKTDCIILDCMNLIPARFDFVEDVNITRHDLDIDDFDPGTARAKLCHCNAWNHVSARKCKACGTSFEIVGIERTAPDGVMERVFRNNDDREQYAFYLRTLKLAYSRNIPPDWADSEFIKKYNRYPPTDWRRASILNNASKDDQSKYKQYLLKVAATKGKPKSWVGEQLSLELGF